LLPDSDEDDIPDFDDACPEVVGKANPDNPQNGCPAADSSDEVSQGDSSIAYAQLTCEDETTEG
jgi:hypothetical protein